MSKSFSTVEDVLTDDVFIAWFSREEEAKVGEWENWITQNPQYQPLVSEAIAFMNNLHGSIAPVSAERTATALSSLNSQLDAIESTPVVPMQKRSPRRWWIATAAAAIAIIASTLLLFDVSSKKSGYATTYGQLEKHELPDGSVVTLNANSSVKISDKWNGEADREVWLKGEAFFNVSKTQNNNRFIVHAGQLDIIVTGTQFNVISRDAKTSVLLTEGSVTILTKEGNQIMMKPGDFVELGNNDGLHRKEVNPENIIAWTDKKLMFEYTPMEKAAEMIEEIYGVEVELSNKEARAIILTGVMPNDNLDILLQSIEASMDCKIVKEGNRIIITGKQ